MNNQIRSRYYRISAKALVLNDAKDAFLITKETNDRWELPGGGIDWGEDPYETIKREVAEEMGLNVTYIADFPCYFLTNEFENRAASGWAANIVYETTLEHLDFTPSEECVEIAFVNKTNMDGFDLFGNVELLLAQFDPTRHQ